jgi:hypothetical protein
MSLIPLYGDIPNCGNDFVNEPVFYIVDEYQESDAVFRYTGRIGFGESKDAMEKRLEEGETTDDTEFITGYCVPYRESDMRNFVFTYNTESNTVRIESYCRLSFYPEEAARIYKNFTLEIPTHDATEHALKRVHKGKEFAKDLVVETIDALKEFLIEDWNETYLYFRFPRSKEGIAMTRAMNYIFKDRPPIQIVYPLINQI